MSGERLLQRPIYGGLIGDDGLNLIASCVPCNLGRIDKTAIECVISGEQAE